MTIMEKEKNSVGLSRDFIIHPGETLAEILEDREMSQRDLAVRTGMTEKHISTVVHGQKNISAAFARKLEYALGIEAAFWMNLQANYDRELLEFEELNNISEKELDVLKSLKEVLECWDGFGWVNKDESAAALVLDVRRIFGVSDLCNAPKISYMGAYRAQIRSNTNPYILFAWQRMCERLAKNSSPAEEVDVEKLREEIPAIKKIMFLPEKQIPGELTSLFSECGVSFKIVPNFKGAPVQGFIKKAEDGVLILCVTLRLKFADIFWFTVFHEIAHILNGDTRNRFVDFDSVSGEVERKADLLAENLLIDSEAYRKFVQKENYADEDEIRKFAAAQNVKEYIVQGRLMKEKRLPWSARYRYDWL